ncbi:hypothetical protein VPJ68_09080, partial [Parabacteroides distasonis]
MLDNLNISTINEGIIINTDALVTHHRGNKPTINLNLKKIEIAPDAADRMLSAITDKHIPEAVMKLGTIRIGGRMYTANDTKAAAHINIRTAAGVANIDAKLTYNDNITGNIATDNFDLGYILSNAKLGAIAAYMQIGGNIHDHNNP